MYQSNGICNNCNMERAKLWVKEGCCVVVRHTDSMKETEK